eukprot:5008783-Karenia_brevis.AAC.1
MVYSLADNDIDVCPSIAILYKRVLMVRRTSALWPKLHTKMQRIYDIYARGQYKGSAHKDLNLSLIHI